MENNEGIDFRRLEKELASALEADARYERENSAKFRAVEQRVGSYEEFRDIVAASHLKPLDRTNITGEKERVQPWNLLASKELTKSKTQSQGTIPNKASKLPQTCHEFTRHWRHLSNAKEEKYNFLCEVGGELIGKIFKAEISLGLLGEFIEILNGCWHDDDCCVVFSILINLAKTNRFSLSLKFLNSTEKDLVNKLFNKLFSCCTKKESEENTIDSTCGQIFTKKNTVELARTYCVYL